jgi:lytic cellulose monooxygenase (C1-hydroxylating)
MPQSNSPLTNVGAKDFTCNVGGTRGVAGKCPVVAGGSVTVEMHQVCPAHNTPKPKRSN